MPISLNVSTWSGWVYVAFVIDAYSRRILGWRTATTMNTQLVLDAIEHAIWTRAREGITDLTGLIDHHDRGAQYTSIAYTERLAEAGIDASIGTTGDSYDNALAETINGLYKTELIKPRGPWRTADHVEIATLEWVDWFNHRRLYEHCGDVPQPNSRPPTTVTTEPGKPPSSQTSKSPDTPSGFTVVMSRDIWTAEPTSCGFSCLFLVVWVGSRGVDSEFAERSSPVAAAMTRTWRSWMSRRAWVRPMPM